MSAGRIIFHGTVDETKSFFESLNKVCPPLYNPAEFYLNTISDPRQCLDIVSHLERKKSKLFDDFQEEFVSSSSSSEISIESDKDNEKLSWLRQCKVISHRLILNFFRDPKQYLIELLILFVSIVFSLIVLTGPFGDIIRHNGLNGNRLLKRNNRLMPPSRAGNNNYFGHFLKNLHY